MRVVKISPESTGAGAPTSSAFLGVLPMRVGGGDGDPRLQQGTGACGTKACLFEDRAADLPT